MKKKIAIIIPSYNEQDCIGQLVSQISKFVPGVKIVVVDDCSVDNSREIVKKTKKAVLLELPINLGIGGAVQAGLKYANRNGYQYVVRLDGDGQHDPKYIKKMLEPLINDEADMCIGSRFLDSKDGFQSTCWRRMGIKIFTLLNRLIIKKNITDSTSGYRAYNRTLIEFLDINYPSFDYPEPEEVILLGKNGFRIKDVPVKMKERIGGNSSIKSLKPAYYMIKVIFAIFMVVLRPKISPQVNTDEHR